MSARPDAAARRAQEAAERLQQQIERAERQLARLQSKDRTRRASLTQRIQALYDRVCDLDDPEWL